MTLVKLNNKPVVRTFNNLFDELLNDFPSRWEREYTHTVPAVNISEATDAYHIDLNVPGRNKEDFKISIEKGLLTVSFEKKEEQNNPEVKHIRREFSLQNFKRSFSLNETVDTDHIQAKYENGILKFNLPKKEQAKEVTKQISVQ